MCDDKNYIYAIIVFIANSVIWLKLLREVFVLWKLGNDTNVRPHANKHIGVLLLYLIFTVVITIQYAGGYIGLTLDKLIYNLGTVEYLFLMFSQLIFSFVFMDHLIEERNCKTFGELEWEW